MGMEKKALAERKTANQLAKNRNLQALFSGNWSGFTHECVAALRPGPRQNKPDRFRT
jgi:hypothetical protein